MSNRTPVEFDLADGDDIRTLRECGAEVEAGGIRLGGRGVRFSSGPVGSNGPRGQVSGGNELGRDGYRITREDGELRIEAASRAGRLSALLAVPEMLAAGRRTHVQTLRLNRRFYKHEIFRSAKPGQALARYSETFWAGLCRELVRRHFNGVIVYLSGEPFPLLADYGSYERYAWLPAEVRAANRIKFAQFLDTARRYGLETLVQQYITKIPGKLARDIGIPFYDLQDPAATTSDFRHPRVYEFHRELYGNFFRDLPGLSRLMINFESAPNSTEFCREVLLPVLGGLARPPDLHFRLWYMTNPEALCDWIAAYPGDCMVSHKIMDTMDAYVHPAPDSRVREWKAWFAARGLKVNWNYCLGPCHNCGSNISRRHWSDPEFIYQVVQRAERLGADGFSFHSIYELLAGEFDSGEVVDPEERAMGRLNQFHLEAVVDVVRGGRFDAAQWVDRTEKQFGVKRPVARRVFAAMRDTSRAEIMHLLQFPLTTSEGYAVEARRQLAQHSLYHPPANMLLDGQQTADPHAMWSYIDKCLPSRSYPADLQAIIDYVDPDKAKTARNPAVLAREMRRLGVSSERTARGLLKNVGASLATTAGAGKRRPYNKIGKTWLREVSSNRWLAEACALDIESAIALFRLYFPMGRARAVACVEKSMACLRALQGLIRLHGMPYIHMQEDYAPELDLNKLARLRRHLTGDYPLKCFQAYVASVKIYNDVRRHMRPWRVYSEATVAKAARLLRRAEKICQRSLDIGKEGRGFRERMEAWRDYVAMELVWLTQPPAFACSEAWAPWQPMVHDNCFGYGGFAWEDFLGFFEDRPRDKELDLRCSVRREPDALLVRVREAGVDGDARRRRWQTLEGNHDLAGITRVFLDVGGEDKLLRQWSLIPLGPVVVERPMVCLGRNRFDMRAERFTDGCAAKFSYEANTWEVTFRATFAMLGRVPKQGDTWWMNVAANTPIKRNHAMSWCKGYEVGAGNPSRMGKIVF